MSATVPLHTHELALARIAALTDALDRVERLNCAKAFTAPEEQEAWRDVRYQLEVAGRRKRPTGELWVDRETKT